MVVIELNGITVKYFILAFLIFLTPVCQSNNDVWIPRPNFSIEGSNYNETLNFISGISYGFTYSNKALHSQGKESFFCLVPNSLIGSKEIIELLNEKLTGDYTSEVILETLVIQLINKYPCNPSKIKEITH